MYVVFVFTHEFVINKDTSACLTHDNFLVQANVQLALRGDFAEAAATGITLDFHDGQSVVGVLADALESGEQSVIYFGL